MKKFMSSEKGLSFVLVIAVVMAVFIGITQVQAADIILEGKVTSVTQKVTQRGNAYTIITLPVSREMNGVKYTTELSVFCFKDSEAKLKKAGDTVKMVAKQTTSKAGDEFITLIAFVK